MTDTTLEMKRPMLRRMDGVITAVLSAVLLSLLTSLAVAQEPIPDGPAPAPWGPAGDKRKNTTVLERGKAKGGVRLVALLTGDGQQIEQGLVWRVFRPGPRGKAKLVLESRDPSPIVKLPPGEYTVNAAFGRANLTRKIAIKADGPPFEAFVLNAGGLRVTAMVGGKLAPQGAVSYSIYPEDRDDAEDNTAIISGVKPNLVIRLNSGIYRLVSIYGDANAKVESDVTVEAGKLTETTVAHAGGKVTFMLVTRTGGEAMPDTRWTIQTEGGETVKESVGALPTHILAPGKYVVMASSGGHLFQNKFQVNDGTSISVEVLMTNVSDGVGDQVSSGATTIAPTSGGAPLDFRNP